MDVNRNNGDKSSNISLDSGIANSTAGIHRFSHNAMATIFEILVSGADERYARQAAWEAFKLADRLEGDLSRYIENSDISRINKAPAGEAVRVSLDTFDCLRLCKEISGETGGAFDVTVGLLMKCWLNEDKSARDPSAAELKWAEQRTGMAFIQLDESRYAVRLTASPMLVDLGAFGKGYTVDKMVELLREWDIETVLVHAGFSSVYAAGFLSPAGGWPVSISDPEESKRVLAKILLRDESLSGSGLQKGHHIIDPRSGKPVTGKRATWALAGDAATADALSTAFMVMSREEISEYCRLHRGTGGVVLPEPAEVGKAADIFFYGEFPQ